jgi:hypothetical protein
MSHEISLPEQWATLLEGYKQLNQEAEASLGICQADLISAQAEIDGFELDLYATWPSHVLDRPLKIRIQSWVDHLVRRLPYRLSKYLQGIPSIIRNRIERLPNRSRWYGSPRVWLNTYRLRMKSAMTAEISTIEWRLERSRLAWLRQFERIDRASRGRLGVSQSGLQNVLHQVDSVFRRLERARLRAHWLLSLPLVEIRVPRGAARYLPFSRGDTHYTFPLILSIARAQTEYRKTLLEMGKLSPWFPDAIGAQIKLELCKLSFYRLLLRPASGRLEAILQDAKEAATLLTLNDSWSADLAGMERLSANGLER